MADVTENISATQIYIGKIHIRKMEHWKAMQTCYEKHYSIRFSLLKTEIELKYFLRLD